MKKLILVLEEDHKTECLSCDGEKYTKHPVRTDGGVILKSFILMRLLYM